MGIINLQSDLETYWRKVSENEYLEPKPGTILVSISGERIKYNPYVFHNIFDIGRVKLEDFIE